MESNGTIPEENEKPKDPLRAPSPTPQESIRGAKAVKILDVCRAGDIETLRTLATSEGGLISDDVRRQAC